MKKMIFAVATVFALASCKKDWTCTCTASYEGVTGTESHVYANNKKSEAKDKCKALETTAKSEAEQAGYTGYSGSCELK